jgi:hypothetical protein
MQLHQPSTGSTGYGIQNKGQCFHDVSDADALDQAAKEIDGKLTQGDLNVT